MNERIKQLYEQAHIERRQEYFSSVVDPTIKSVSVTRHFDPNKFAELIIKECAEQIKTHGISASSEDYGDYEIGFNAGLFHALRTSKEHFGVEE